MKKVLISTGIVLIFLISGWIFWHGQEDSSPVMHPETKYAFWAFLIGAIATISLPLGAITGITLKPGSKLTAALTAFGAGALLAALSVELIAPTVIDIVGQSGTEEHKKLEKSHAILNMGALIMGCLAGGFLFYTLDELINSKGGVIRKAASYVNFLKRKKSNSDVTEEEFKSLSDSNNGQESAGAPMAIWLGLLIDGIPESFVIGAGFLGLLEAKRMMGETDPGFTSILPFTLIAGLFLSNFPEALAASLGMKKSGLSNTKIILLWLSLVAIIAIGSLTGYYIGSSIPHEIEIGIEGLAAGAMLTMIGQTMLPEAVHLGGTKVVGLSTLAGYLSAVAFKIFE
ncbi:MAG: ZIP family metal transporter [Bacteroidota bacterium]|jgi:zinc transporter ZupT